MTGHRYRISDIARQARLSRATVDRVLHARSGVRPETVAQVEHAIAELTRQRSEILLTRVPAIFDLVVQSCAEFGMASRTALESQVRSLRAHGLRTRSHIETSGDARAIVGVLDDIARRGSNGVILKAAADIEVSLAVNRLAEAGIPTVTYVTDLPDSRRIGHVGLDHAAAGRTAAYLISQWSPASSAVLVALTRPYLTGQIDRRRGFLETLGELQPGRAVLEYLGDQNRDDAETSMSGLLEKHGDIDAIYVANSHCAPALAAFASLGRTPRVVIAHDLGPENIASLRQRRLSAVLDYDIDGDLQKICIMLLQAKAVLPGFSAFQLSQVQVMTPFNLPGAI